MPAATHVSGGRAREVGPHLPRLERDAAVHGSGRVSRRGPQKNLPASVRQRLLNLSRERGEDFNFTLTRYANERLLYRLARSPYRDQFVLKGAALFQVWSESPHRPTRDVDLLGFGDSTAAIPSYRSSLIPNPPVALASEEKKGVSTPIDTLRRSRPSDAASCRSA